MPHLLRDIRYAARALARTPLFTLGIVLTLGLGIGVNAAMFGVVDTLFLRPPAGVHGADRVVRLYVRRTDPFFGTNTQGIGIYPAFVDIRSGGAFERAAAVRTQTMSLGRGEDAVSVNVGAVSADYFPLLGLAPARGRFFTADEDREGGARVVVLTEAFWRSRYAGDPGIVGRTLLIGSGPATVIGVAPRGFGGIDLKPVDMFMPIVLTASETAGKDALTSRNWWWMDAIALLQPGQRPEDAAARATLLYRRGATDKADSAAQVILGPIQEARGPEASSEAKVSGWIGFVALAVLLIACANVANLLLARGVSRRRELAVRAGLGAGRGGLARMMLSESLVLAAAGGVAAVVLAAWSGALARGLLIPDLPKDVPVIDARVLLFTLGAILLTGLLTGLVPAIQFSRADLADALKSGGRTTAGGGRTRAMLLVAQIALTLVLLVGAGLFVRSLRNVQHINLGFDADRVLEAQVDMRSAGLSDADANATYLRMVDRVRRLPGVAGAAAMLSPFQWAWAVTLHAQGVDSIRTPKTGGPYINGVTPGYFTTLGTRLVRGRDFTDQDAEGSARVALMNEAMAKGLWPHENAIGKCLYVGSDSTKTCTQVVGIVGDAVNNGVTEGETWRYFVPFSQVHVGLQNARINGMVVRSRGKADDIVRAVRQEMQAVGNLPYAQVQSLADRIAPDYRSWQLGAAAFTAFGMLALLIAAMGIFAVISYSVGRRTQEIGVRMALGAEAGQVARMVLGQGLRAAVAGVAIGAAGAWALGRGMRALLYEVAPGDPAVFVTVSLVLVVVAMLAGWLPARRAARIDPMVALRYE